MQTSDELSSLQRRLAGNAVQIAEAFGATLDFSHDSIDAVECVLGRLHDELQSTGNDDGYNGIALSFAAYIVTVIEQNLSPGIWKRDDDEMGPETFPFEWAGRTLFPHGWCLKRLFEGSADNVAVKYRALVLDQKT